jgi:streptogramin lyase
MRTWAVGALAVSVLVSGSCGDDDAERAASTTSTAPPTTVLAPEGYPVTDVADRQDARLRIDSPDWLATDGTSLWVKRDDGSVERIDPETNEVISTVDNDGAHCAGIGVGFGSVWTCSVAGEAPHVARYDAETGELQATIPVVKAAIQGHLATGFDHVWVLTGDGSTLVGIDPETDAPAVTVDLGIRGTDLETGEAGLWVVSTLDDQVLRIDPDTGEVVHRVTEVLKPTAVSVTDDVWVAAQLSTNQIDPDTGEVVVTSEIGTGANGGIAVTDDAVWVRSAKRFLVRLDPTDGQPVEGFSSADTPSAGSVLVAFGSVWATAYDDEALFRIPIG